MRLIVDLTEREYGEAVAAVQAEHVKLLGQRARNSPTQILWVIAVVVLGVVIIRLAEAFQLDSRPQIRPTMYHAILVCFPLIGLMVLIGVINAARQWGDRKRAARGLVRFFLPVMLLLVIGAGLWMLLHWLRQLPPAGAPAGASTSFETDWFGVLYPQWPWLVAMGLIAVFSVRSSRIMIKQLWRAQPNLALPRTVELSAFGLTIEEAATQRRYQWPAIVRFLETPSLLLLCPSDITFEPIPKRCFATPDELAAARALIQHQMALSKPHSAFPVQPPASRTAVNG